ncbi:uncharacterized protein LOC111404760 [Olea europaea var. sylvestris]|uniref:uncharacterized protein LOC111404760 n=1 Tax=Olea europaea var. sylvestris TaxID=158386 RepID=UPI000C1D8977|nr:uncharacterized protein LOC111404760 [Olea europaea var. sylvestris]
MEKLQLNQNMRAQNDKQFAQYLIQIGNGTEPYIEDDFINLSNEIAIALFSNLTENATSSNYMTEHGILSTKNEYVDYLNDKLIGLFPGESEEFVNFDEAIDDTNQFYQEEFLNTLLPNGIPPHKLILKRNCPMMLLRNLDPSNGLYNETRMICRNFKKHNIHTKIIVGQHSGTSLPSMLPINSSK